MQEKTGTEAKIMYSAIISNNVKVAFDDVSADSLVRASHMLNVCGCPQEKLDYYTLPTSQESPGTQRIQAAFWKQPRLLALPVCVLRRSSEESWIRDDEFEQYRPGCYARDCGYSWQRGRASGIHAAGTTGRTGWAGWPRWAYTCRIIWTNVGTGPLRCPRYHERTVDTVV